MEMKGNSTSLMDLFIYSTFVFAYVRITVCTLLFVLLLLNGHQRLAKNCYHRYADACVCI